MMKFTALVALPCMALAMSASPEAVARMAFEEFKEKYGRKYTSAAEEKTRFDAFKASLDRVAASGNPTHGITQFSDLTPQEFREQYLMPNRPARPATNAPEWDGECTACKKFPQVANLGANASWDWTQHGAVTHVKNQKQCGSCWTFGTTGDIEGVWFLGGHELTALSEQMIVSCDRSGHGCGGGWQSQAMEWVIAHGGLVTESTYPYTSGDGRSGRCQADKETPIVAKISSWYQVSRGASGESNIQQQLPAVGPITIDLDATPMQDYRHGIDNPRNCNPQNLDHAVLIVGFGEENGVKYWKIKNSWGTTWGEDGYYRIVRGENKCGLAQNAVHSKL